MEGGWSGRGHECRKRYHQLLLAEYDGRHFRSVSCLLNQGDGL